MKALEQKIDDATEKVANALRWYDGFYLSHAKATALTIYQENRHCAENERKQALEAFSIIIDISFTFNVYDYVRKVANGIKRKIEALSSDYSYYQKEQIANHLIKYFTDFTNYVVYLANPCSRNAKDNPDKDKAVAAMCTRKYMMILGVTVGCVVLPWIGLTLYG